MFMEKKDILGKLVSSWQERQAEKDLTNLQGDEFEKAYKDNQLEQFEKKNDWWGGFSWASSNGYIEDAKAFLDLWFEEKFKSREDLERVWSNPDERPKLRWVIEGYWPIKFKYRVPESVRPIFVDFFTNGPDVASSIIDGKKIILLPHAVR